MVYRVAMTETASPTVSATPVSHPLWAKVLGWIGIAAHLVVGYLYLASGLVAPTYGIIILWVIWAALLALAIVMLRRSPAWTLLIPLVALGVLYGGIALGESLLGWGP